jgi:lipoprotein-releasing system permease protein
MPVAVQVFIGLLIQGLQEGLVDSTIGNSSQITIKPPNNENSIHNLEEIISKLENSEVPLLRLLHCLQLQKWLFL